MHIQEIDSPPSLKRPPSKGLGPWLGSRRRSVSLQATLTGKSSCCQSPGARLQSAAASTTQNIHHWRATSYTGGMCATATSRTSKSGWKGWQVTGWFKPTNAKDTSAESATALDPEYLMTSLSHRRRSQTEPQIALSVPSTATRSLLHLPGSPRGGSRALDNDSPSLPTKSAYNVMGLQNISIQVTLRDILGLEAFSRALIAIAAMHVSFLATMPLVVRVLILVWEASLLTLLCWQLVRLVSLVDDVVDIVCRLLADGLGLLEGTAMAVDWLRVWLYQWMWSGTADTSPPRLLSSVHRLTGLFW